MNSPCYMCWNHGMEYDEVDCHECEADIVFRALKQLLFDTGCARGCTAKECSVCKEHNKFDVDYGKIVDLDLLSSEIK